jgi:two-component system sensor histidine kinase BaeS
MRRWLSSLSGRITLVTTAVAVLAVIMTAAIAFPLIRAASVDAARAALAEAAESFAATPLASLSLEERQQRLIGASGTEVALVTPDGTTVGDGEDYVTDTFAQRALAGQSISDTVTVQGRAVLVETRPTKGGGAVILARPLDTVYAGTGQVLVRLGLALAIGLVLAVLIGTGLARWLAKPLIAAAATARRLANTTASGAEPERASATYARLGRSMVTEVADVTASLDRLDRALQSSEGRQREFLLSISHDIRSPLTALRGYGEALADDLIDRADTKAVGATLVAETERLNRFVTDLLELARLEAEDFKVDAQPTSLEELVLAAERAWKARCTQAGVHLGVEPGDRIPPIVTDAQRVRQIVDGLLENAVRATPTEGSIILALRLTGHPAVPGENADEANPPHQDSWVMIEVRDSGPGLTAADRSIAFDRSALSDKYRGSRAVGSGLGLSIGARLASRLGGRLEVHEAPEGGAAFQLWLPVTR